MVSGPRSSYPSLVGMDQESPRGIEIAGDVLLTGNFAQYDSLLAAEGRGPDFSRDLRGSRL